jgi:hypothetical protein
MLPPDGDSTPGNAERLLGIRKKENAELVLGVPRRVAQRNTLFTHPPKDAGRTSEAREGTETPTE